MCLLLPWPCSGHLRGGTIIARWSACSWRRHWPGVLWLWRIGSAEPLGHGNVGTHTLRLGDPPLDSGAWRGMGCSAAVGYTYLLASLPGPLQTPHRVIGLFLRCRHAAGASSEAHHCHGQTMLG